MTSTSAAGAAALLAAYDAQLRGANEMTGEDVHVIGPLHCSVHRDRGFVSYVSLEGHDPDALVDEAVAFFRDGTDVPFFEWKTRAHDAPADLSERLRARGLVPEDAESVMVGEISGVIQDLPLPEGVTLRALDPGDEESFTRSWHMQGHVFGRRFGTPAEEMARCASSGGLRQKWVAESEAEAAQGRSWGGVVCAGLVDVVPGTEFAGVWGGAALEHWRGKGIYRALTSARARAARELGARYLHSDSTEYSRPILERSGLVRVTETTPYIWTR